MKHEHELGDEGFWKRVLRVKGFVIGVVEEVVG